MADQTKQWYETKVGDEWVEIEASSPEDAAEQAKKLMTPGQAARNQSETNPAAYMRDMVTNIPSSGLNVAKDMLIGIPSMLGTLAKSAAEVGGNTGTFIRDVVTGAEGTKYPGWENTKELGAIVPNLLRHYGQYADPDFRALNVRDNPVGMLLDMSPAAGTKPALSAVKSGVKKVATAPATKAVVGAAADMAPLWGNFRQAAGIRAVQRGIENLGGKVEEALKPSRAAGAGPRGGRSTARPAPTVAAKIDKSVESARAQRRAEKAKTRTEREQAAKKANAGGRVAPKPKIEDTIREVLEQNRKDYPEYNTLPSRDINPADVTSMPFDRLGREEQLLRNVAQGNVPMTLEDVVDAVANAKDVSAADVNATMISKWMDEQAAKKTRGSRTVEKQRRKGKAEAEQERRGKTVKEQTTANDGPPAPPRRPAANIVRNKSMEDVIREAVESGQSGDAAAHASGEFMRSRGVGVEPYEGGGTLPKPTSKSKAMKQEAKAAKKAKAKKGKK